MDEFIQLFMLFQLSIIRLPFYILMNYVNFVVRLLTALFMSLYSNASGLKTINDRCYVPTSDHLYGDWRVRNRRR